MSQPAMVYQSKTGSLLLAVLIVSNSSNAGWEVECKLQSLSVLALI